MLSDTGRSLPAELRLRRGHVLRFARTREASIPPAPGFDTTANGFAGTLASTGIASHTPVLSRENSGSADEMRNLFKTKHLPLEVLELESMASGNHSLRVSTLVTWEAFASPAPAVVDLLGRTINERADAVNERAWTAIIDRHR